MRNIIILLICMFYHTCYKQQIGNNVNSDDFNFNTLFQKFKIENKLQIIDVKKQDYFKGNLVRCNDFYKGLTSNQMYYLKNRNNDIIVEEYIFNNITFAKKAFLKVVTYADFSRKLKRKDYAQRCYEIWDEQVYYAINKNTHIYLLTTTNNLKFENGNISVDDIFINNKEVLIDDLYNILK